MILNTYGTKLYFISGILLTLIYSYIANLLCKSVAQPRIFQGGPKI